MPTDNQFGNSGTIWSIVPTSEDLGFRTTRRIYNGGEAVGLNLTPAGPVMVVWTWTPELTGQLTRTVLASFPPDGHPLREDSFAISLLNLSAAGEMSAPLATCGLPNGQTVVLQRVEDTQNNFTLNHPRYVIRVASITASAAGQTRELPLTYQDLFDPMIAPVNIGNPRITPVGPDFVVVSASSATLMIATVHSDGSPVTRQTINLGVAGTGLEAAVKFDIATLSFDGTFLSIAFTAYLNLPAIPAGSVGAILRITPAGVRSPGFGLDGLWLSPLSNMVRNFVCGGEVPQGLAGINRSDAVVFGVTPQGTLDIDFGDAGAFRQPLGGQMVSPVAAGDGNGTFLFARRTDGRTVGCHVTAAGALDPAFGTGGILTLSSADIIGAPRALRLSGGRLFLASTSTIEGQDCDRVPVLSVRNAANGAAVPEFGAGGFTLHAKIVASSSFGSPVAIRLDGSCIYTERNEFGPATALRSAYPEGFYDRRLPIAFDGFIDSLIPLDDGSVLVAGSGTTSWVQKLTPAGVPDQPFGVNSVATIPGLSTRLRLLGALPNGRIAVELETGPNLTTRPAVCFLQSNGTLDPIYAAAGNGFLPVEAFTHAPTPNGADSYQSTFTNLFLQADGSILCAATSSRDTTNSPAVMNGLRRITPAGAYDPAFGLGTPSVATPRQGALLKFFLGVDPNSDYSGVSPVAITIMGGLIYLISDGTTGGFLPSFGDRLPDSGVLVLSRWNPDGTVDPTFPFQQAGRDESLDYRPRDVLPFSPTEMIVFGTAGGFVTETHSIGNQTFQVDIPLRPEPALFRIVHPTGFDATFGTRGADRMPLHEFPATAIAARLLPPTRRRGPSRVRYVCADLRSQRRAVAATVIFPISNFGAIGQFTYSRQLP